ncbi:hypothetical protein, partial [Candidatus Entotheonella palauensis]
MSLRYGAQHPPGLSRRWGRHRGIISLWITVLILWAVEALAITVSLSSTPPPQTIRPDADIARVMLAVQHDGQPLSHGRIQVKVTAPPRPSLLSTDFPVVEATTLLELASDLRDGTFSFDYLFPIRGAYTFDVALQPVAGSPQFAPTTIQTSWQLRENPAEIRNVWLLVLGLFILGGVFGLVLARSAQAKSALLLTAMLVFTGLVMRAEGDVRGQAEASKTQQAVRGEHGWALQVNSTPAQGTVGQQVRFDMVLTKDGEVFAEATELSLELHHIEDDKSIFKTNILAPKGETSQQLQFFDGAPHRVKITAHPAAGDPADPNHQPLQAVFDMEVNGIQPPL